MDAMKIFALLGFPVGFAVATATQTKAPVQLPHADTVRVSMSVHQRGQLDAIAKQVEELNVRYNIYIMAIAASKVDPNKLTGWKIAVDDSVLVLISPDTTRKP